MARGNHLLGKQPTKISMPRTQPGPGSGPCPRNRRTPGTRVPIITFIYNILFKKAYIKNLYVETTFLFSKITVQRE